MDYGVPVDQTVECDTNNAGIIDSIPRNCISLIKYVSMIQCLEVFAKMYKCKCNANVLKCYSTNYKMFRNGKRKKTKNTVHCNYNLNLCNWSK